MLRAVLGMAVVTTLCILSPERESAKQSKQPPDRDDGPRSDMLSSLAAQFPAAAANRVAAAAKPQAAVFLDSVGAGAGAGGLEAVRKIVIPPAPVPIEMPPLRR